MAQETAGNRSLIVNIKEVGTVNGDVERAVHPDLDRNVAIQIGHAEVEHRSIHAFALSQGTVPVDQRHVNVVLLNRESRRRSRVSIIELVSSIEEILIRTDITAGKVVNHEKQRRRRTRLAVLHV